MGQKSKFSAKLKLKYVLRCIEGKDSISHTATLIGIDHSVLKQWIYNHQFLGIDGLKTISKNSSHSTALKEMAVKDYLAG
jgi:transposase-like protein